MVSSPARKPICYPLWGWFELKFPAFLGLAGAAAEFGVVMLIYLDQAIERYRTERRLNNHEDLKQAIIEGAALRVRPKR